MLSNATASEFFSEQPADRLAHIWLLTYQIKGGRRWDNAREGFSTFEDAVSRQTWLEHAYKDHVRALDIVPVYFHG